MLNKSILNHWSLYENFRYRAHNNDGKEELQQAEAVIHKWDKNILVKWTFTKTIFKSTMESLWKSQLFLHFKYVKKYEQILIVIFPLETIKTLLTASQITLLET